MPREIQNALQNLAELLLDAVIVVNTCGQVVYTNAACEAVFGYTPEELQGRRLFDFVYPEDQVRTWEESLVVMSGLPRVGFENRYIRKDGSLVHIMWSARWDHERQLRIGVARDITAKKRAAAIQIAGYEIASVAHSTDSVSDLLKEVHRVIAQLLPVAGFAVVELDSLRRPHVLYQKDMTFDSTFILSPVLVRLLRQALHQQRALVLPQAQDTASGTDSSLMVVPLSNIGLSETALVIRSPSRMRYELEDEDLLQFISAQVAMAIEKRRLLDDLIRSARYDELTGLPNRKACFERLGSILAQCQRQQTRAALLYLDLNGFKRINDTYGHVMGDELLRQVAMRLKGAVRSEDAAARLGGDEFVILLPHVTHYGDASAVAEKVGSACGEPINIGEHIFNIGVSIGIALYPDHGIDPTQLMGHADRAMYAEKRFNQEICQLR
jgi:diguanylate cyclase (GGDEF)-like protein/PAS domain S-box-containing protein